MTTYARNVNNVAVDVTTVAPFTIFHPAVAAQFAMVPDGTQNGATFANGTWTNPLAPPPPAAPAHPVLSPMDFYLTFTPAERIAIKASTDPMVKEFWATYELAAQANKPIDPNLPSVQAALVYLATPISAAPPGAGLLAGPARVAQISAGVPQ